VGVSKTEAKLSWYHDPLPTNCVANWVCPGGTGCGFPTHAHREGPEIGYDNLAVFFHACTFNCLFCQNWQFKQLTFDPVTRSVEELVDAVGPRTGCICFFGGDPSAQTPYTLEAAKRIREIHPGRILRICWETNGSMSEALLHRMLAMALDSGGCIKFDLKAWDDHLHRVLTGITNQRTLKNFKIAGKQFSKRTSPPLVVASTLLVPGYIDAYEVEQIAGFIASINPDIPYSLLVFHPQFIMSDLPISPRKLVFSCYDAAKKQGLKHVRIGNQHLL
jgi:pyruvate formate lyase activating enzyme